MSKKPSRRERDMYRGLNDLLSFYKTIGMSVFNWDGMPKNIKPFYPENTLYDQGICCVVPLPGTNDIDIFPVAYGSMELDLHGFPMSWKAYPVGTSPGADILRNTVFTAEDSVLIWNNPERTGTAPYIETQVRNMLMTDNVLKTNTLVQSTPIWVKCDSKNALTAKNLSKEYEIEPWIFGTDITKDSTSFEVINLNVNFLGDKLSDQYETFHDRILRYLGIKHLPVEKQERMLTGEANANDDLLELVVKSRLDCRIRATEEMSDVFGIKPTVELYSNVLEQRNMERMQSTFGNGSQTGQSGKTGDDKQPEN